MCLHVLCLFLYSICTLLRILVWYRYQSNIRNHSALAPSFSGSSFLQGAQSLSAEGLIIAKFGHKVIHLNFRTFGQLPSRVVVSLVFKYNRTSALSHMLVLSIVDLRWGRSNSCARSAKKETFRSIDLLNKHKLWVKQFYKYSRRYVETGAVIQQSHANVVFPLKKKHYKIVILCLTFSQDINFWTQLPIMRALKITLSVFLCCKTDYGP